MTYGIDAVNIVLYNLYKNISVNKISKCTQIST